jgi:RNA ligase
MIDVLNLTYNPHPAVSMPFDVLYSELDERVKKGLVYRLVGEDGLEIYNYSMETSFSKEWDIYSLISRGLILCPAEKKIVALTYPKFFNFSEATIQLPNLPFRTSTKYDGSLLILWYFNGEWRTSTRGSFKSEQSVWAAEWLKNNVDLSLLNPDNTYLFEVIYWANRIVVSYDFEGLVLLTAFNKNSGYEWDYENLCDFARKINVRVKEIHNYSSVDEIVKICETLGTNEEGFVVEFTNGYRVKIKGTQYLRLHKIVSNVTPLRIWDMMLNDDPLEVIEKELPEEHKTDFNRIRFLLSEKIEQGIKDIEAFYEATKHLSDKEVGMLDNKMITDLQKHFVFPCRKKNFLTEWKIGGSKMRRAYFNHFRPVKNHLDNYVQSNAMNRFTEGDDN